MAEAVGPASFSRGRIPAFLSAHSCGFPPDEPGSDVSFRHRSPVRRPPRGIRRSVPFSPAFQSSRSRFAPLGRFVPGSAHGIQPFAALFRPDSSATSSVAEAHLTFACRILLDGFGRGIGWKTGTDPIGAKHPQGRSGQWGLSPFSGRSECGRFVFWALTRPASRPLPVVRQGAHAALGFASFGPADTCWCSLTGSSPSSLIGRRPFRFRRLSALGLQRRSPALPEPRWFAGPEPVSPPALQRFQRPMPCSSDAGGGSPPEYRREPFTRGRMSFPYEVFNLLTRFRCTR